MAARKPIAAVALIVIIPSVALGAEIFGVAASDGNTACVAVHACLVSLSAGIVSRGVTALEEMTDYDPLLPVGTVRIRKDGYRFFHPACL